VDEVLPDPSRWVAHRSQENPRVAQRCRTSA
jgi:hypothetical protein